MKRATDFVLITANLAVVGVLVLVLVLAFRAVSGRGAAGIAVTAGATTQPYPPPQPTTVPQSTFPPEPPTITAPPVPTPLPTPVVTVIPTSQPPIIPTATGQVPGSYTIAFHDGSMLHTITSNGINDSSVVDIPIPPPLFLVGRTAGIRPWAWGSLSPDRSQLALVLGDSEAPNNIYLLNLSNRNFQRLAQSGVEPVWSPDGTKIAYRSTQTFGLRIVDVATEEFREIFSVDRTNQDYWVNFFTWSPDSRKIAFIKTVGILEVGEIWVTDADGEGQAVLLVSEEMAAGNITWSPTEDQILFISEAGEHVTPERPLSLWVVDVGTSGRRQLTQNISFSGANWSPDGDWIVLTGVNMLEGISLTYDLWLIAEDGSNLKRLTNDEASDHNPFWISDVSRVVFRKVGNGIWELNIDTGSFKQLAAQESEYITVR